MGKSWTTPEQERWLEERLTAYLNVHKSNKKTRFLTVTQEKWFTHFSERKFCFPNKPDDIFLTEEESAIVSDAIIKRKAQIRDWYKNHSRKFNATIGPLQRDTEILSALNLEAAKYGKPERAPHRIESYLKLFPGKVESVYAPEVDRLEQSTGIKLTSGVRLNLRRNIAFDLLEAETPGNQKVVDDEIVKWKVEHADVKLSADGDPTFVPPTPEEYQRSIDSLPNFLITAFNALSRASGWSFMILGGGPVPKEGGKVFVEDYHFGPKSIAGNDFRAAHADFERDIERAYCDHVLNCFAPDIQASRVLIRRTARGIDAEQALLNPVRGVDAAKVMSTPSGPKDNQALVGASDLGRLTSLELGDRQSTPPIGLAFGMDLTHREISPPIAPADHYMPAVSTRLDPLDLGFDATPNLRPAIFSPSPASDYCGQPGPVSFVFPTYDGPVAPGGPTEHILHAAFSRMDPVSSHSSINEETPRLPAQGLEHQAPPLPQPVVQPAPQIRMEENPVGRAAPNNTLAGRKRKADAGLAEDTLATRRGRREIRPPPRADKNVEGSEPAVKKKGKGKGKVQAAA